MINDRKNILDQFLKDTANHKLTVNYENGVYRDITIHKPGSSEYHYNINTRPGYLTITGDMGSYTFLRLYDMFDFFRRDTYSINPDYWSEKIEGTCSRSGTKKFSCALVLEALNEYLTNHIDALISNCDYEYDDLDDEIGHTIIDSETQQKIDDAKKAVEDFKLYNDENEWSYVAAINDWDESEAGGMDLDDFWSYDVTTYTYHYIWICYAIVHAIKLYDEHKNKSWKNVCTLGT